MKKLFSWLLILVGIGVLLYPTAQTQYYQYKQEKMISSWEESLLTVDSLDTNTEIIVDIDTVIDTDSSLSDVISVNASTDIQEPSNNEEEERIAKEEEEKRKAEYIKKNMEGILVIDSIDLKLPIIRGASAENMLLTVTSFENTGIPGEIGNYAIIGHRNLTYGRNFNRLGEMKVGDIIKVITDNGTFNYTVNEIFLVLPNDVGVLFGTKLEKRITLITCDPMGNPTHRLIIRGNIIE